MNIVGIFIFGILGYLLGAIPFAVIIARSKGVDIFSFGSGNPGATNVKRACGKFAGNLCFFLDALKGFLAAILPVWVSMFVEISDVQILCVAGLLAAIAGHMYPVFTKFRGGKGVSVTIGGLVAFMWAAILIGLIIWVAAYYSTKYVSVASILMAASLPISSPFLYGAASIQTALAVFLAFAVIYKHKSNIQRLLNGTENRFK
ncbi:glycerol-3-phosphate 1-O-acyltransferase PlsY [Intestinicryptomonas porci]|uniref:Glycerol-3-phosphate acyltransferase n=1 Tax=Intestinicryptomonas porci TaxID=2926320 RepID=A0ABU4WKD9_9BACT|nr:glycerol-3-phosphate 1-O-acyltransferase PlsY [Opitutales bacterium CLA-KB-P66]